METAAATFPGPLPTSFAASPAAHWKFLDLVNLLDPKA